MPRERPEHRPDPHRRPRRPRRRRLRLGGQPHPAHRRDRRAWRAVRALLRHQLPVLPEPGLDPHRHLQPRARRPHAGHPHRRVPADVRHPAARGGLPHRDRRQVAPGRRRDRRRLPRPAGLRLLGRPHRPGRVLRPAVPVHRRPARRARVRHRRHHRPVAALAGVPGRRRRPVVPAGLPQGAAPVVGARRGAPGHVRRPDRASRPRSPTTWPPAATRRSAPRCGSPTTSNAEDLKQPVPEGLSRRGGGAVEVPALHGGLPRLRRLRRRQRRPRTRLAARARPARRHAADLHLRPGLLPR